MQRRRFIVAAGTASAGLIAGCSEEDLEDNGGNDGGDNGGGDSGLQVRVEYSGEWSGAAGGDGSTRTIQGQGTETVDIDDDSDIVSANAQKQDDSRDTLIIQILDDSEVVAEQSTSAEFGLAQVTYDNF